MSDEFGLVEPDAVEGVGDEWETIDVSDTEADRVARSQDREFAQFRKRLKDTERFKVDEGVFDDATAALRDALAGARRRIPAAYAKMAREMVLG